MTAAVVSRRNGRRWSKESIIEAIRDHATRTGTPPTADEWKLGGDHPSYGAIRRFFGSWKSAMAAAGFDVWRGKFSLNSEGRRATFDERFRVGWTRSTSARDVHPLVEAQQMALLSPSLRDIVIGQLRDDHPRVFPQVFRDAPEIPSSELNFERGVEEGFERWLITVMDYKNEIDDWGTLAGRTASTTDDCEAVVPGSNPEVHGPESRSERSPNAT